MGPGMFDGLVEAIFRIGVLVGLGIAVVLSGLIWFFIWLFGHLQWV